MAGPVSALLVVRTDIAPAVYELDDLAAVHSPAFAERRGWGPFKPHVTNNNAAIYVLLTTKVEGA